MTVCFAIFLNGHKVEAFTCDQGRELVNIKIAHLGLSGTHLHSSRLCAVVNYFLLNQSLALIEEMQTTMTLF